jgi:chemotaxis protein MotC
LWPEKAAVENDKQPYMLVRAMRSLQDEIAAGSITAHKRQREVQRDISEQMTRLPPAVWDDIRNVRAAIYFVLGGGDAAVLKPILGRPKTPHLERRLLRGTLAYGEGRLVDALSMMHKLEARNLDPLLGGIVALIQGTLVAKKDGKKAIAYFDEARLLSPGTLVEESALRQQILLVAREGDLARFDVLSGQYSRRFPRSLFAKNFRRQFFAGVARQTYKPPEEWVQRTETELQKVPASERVGLYLAIADEATKGGSVSIARFAAGKARDLATPGSRALQRAMLYEGAALVATEDFEKGLELLNTVDLMKLTTSERQIHSSAVGVATAVGKWPVATEAFDEEPPEAVGRAQAVLTKVDSLLGGTPQ